MGMKFSPVKSRALLALKNVLLQKCIIFCLHCLWIKESPTTSAFLFSAFQTVRYWTKAEIFIAAFPQLYGLQNHIISQVHIPWMQCHVYFHLILFVTQGRGLVTLMYTVQARLCAKIYR